MCYSQKLDGYGAKLGLVVANQTWNYAQPTNFTPTARSGLGFGGFIEFAYKPSIHLMIELDYVQKGFNADIVTTVPAEQVDTGGGPGTTTQTKTIKPRADYLSLPVTVKFVYNSNIISPYAFAGPRLDYMIGRNSDGAVFDNFHRWDAGISIGGGFGIYSKSSFSGFIEIRYSPSFTPTYKSDQVTVKNTSFEVLAGIKFLSKQKK
jgi:hypothetical protein